jgi:hypothetical protein
MSSELAEEIRRALDLLEDLWQAVQDADHLDEDTRASVGSSVESASRELDDALRRSA